MVRIYCHVKPISLSNIFTYWDTFSIYHTCPKIWKSPFCYLLMCLKFCCMYTSSSVDPDQMLHSAHSDLGLLPCRQRPICPSTYGYYSVWFIVLVIDQLDMALMNWFFIVIWFCSFFTVVWRRRNWLLWYVISERIWLWTGWPWWWYCSCRTCWQTQDFTHGAKKVGSVCWISVLP